MGGFRRTRRGVVAVFDETDRALLRSLLTELLDLLDAGDTAEAGEDPLAAAVGIGTSTSPPSDPALARLFPDGYREDPEAAAEFRRYTEVGLRSGKQANARTALDTLADETGRRRLNDEEAPAWLAALNDIRLAIGTRLGVTEDLEETLSGLAPDDPRAHAFAVYDYLTWLQESLVQALL